MTKNIKFDLEDRTAKFGKEIVLLCQKVPKDIITTPIISQLVRAGTSVGANYREANGASSRKDFVNKIYISKKEAKETQYWLEILEASVTNLVEDCRKNWQEAKELAMIFSTIASKTRQTYNDTVK